jgi:hypothetical protein
MGIDKYQRVLLLPVYGSAPDKFPSTTVDVVCNGTSSAVFIALEPIYVDTSDTALMKNRPHVSVADVASVRRMVLSVLSTGSPRPADTVTPLYKCSKDWLYVETVSVRAEPEVEREREPLAPAVAVCELGSSRCVEGTRRMAPVFSEPRWVHVPHEQRLVRLYPTVCCHTCTRQVEHPLQQLSSSLSRISSSALNVNSLRSRCRCYQLRT